MRRTVPLALVAMAQLIVGAALQLLVFATIGVGLQSDAFVAAQAVPMVLTAVLATGLQGVWQPRLAVAGGQPVRWRGLHRTAHAQALLLLILTALVFGLTAPWWTIALYPTLGSTAIDLLLALTGLLLAAMVFNGASAVLVAAERGRERFVPAELVQLTGSLAALAAVPVVLEHWGLLGVASLLLLRGALVWLTLGWMVDGVWPDWEAGLRGQSAWRQLAALIPSNGLSKSAPLVDRYWSALGPVGSITILGISQTGMGAIAAVIERSLSMPIGTHVARLLSIADWQAARGVYREAMRSVLLATLGVAALLMAVRPWWSVCARHLLGLPPEQAEVLWWICVLLLGYVFVAGAGTAAISVLHAVGDGRTPLLISLCAFVAGLVVKGAGFMVGGLAGLAVGISTYHLVTFFALVWAVERRLGRGSAHRTTA